MTHRSGGKWASEDPLSLSEIDGSGGVPTDVKQEGESPAFRAGKGQVFPTVRLSSRPKPANLERVTAKALKRGDKESSSPGK